VVASSVTVSQDGRRLYVASANGAEHFPTMTSHQTTWLTQVKHAGYSERASCAAGKKLADYTRRVLANNGFIPSRFRVIESNSI